MLLGVAFSELLRRWGHISIPLTRLKTGFGARIGDLGLFPGACDVCADNRHLYVIVSNRVEKRVKGRFELVERAQLPDFYPQRCVASSDRLYITHSRGVLEFTSGLRLIRDAPRSKPLFPFSASVYSNQLYVVGTRLTSNRTSGSGVIEVWSLPNLSLISTYNSRHCSTIYKISLNPVTNHLWLMGADGVRFCAEVYDKNMFLVSTVREPIADLGEAVDVDFDEGGYAYVLADKYLFKFTMNGSMQTWGSVAIGSTYITPLGLAYANGYVYVLVSQGYSKPLLLVFDRNLRRVDKVDLSSGVAKVFGGRVLHDNKNLYIALAIESSSSREWVVHTAPLLTPRQVVVVHQAPQAKRVQLELQHPRSQPKPQQVQVEALPQHVVTVVCKSNLVEVDVSRFIGFSIGEMLSRCCGSSPLAKVYGYDGLALRELSPQEKVDALVKSSVIVLYTQ
jgi:hypothetical protein